MTTTFAPRAVLVTGGAGFIGSNFIRWLLATEPSVSVLNLDLLTYAGNLESLTDVEDRHGPGGDGRYLFVHGDIRDQPLVASLLAGGRPVGSRHTPPPDALMHFAAESHVDRSLLDAAAFVSTNVGGTQALLAETRAELEVRPREFRFVNVSTDEVYGSLDHADAPFAEEHPLAPNSPYSASKAGADCMVRAYRETFGLPCITVRCSNNYGAWQFPEKLIPLVITRAIDGDPIPIYGDGRQVRDWLHVNDHASALWAVCTRGAPARGIYNVGGESEMTNLEVVELILGALGKPKSLISHVADRRGHDRRYAIDIARIRGDLGWSPSGSFTEKLVETVRWYCDNEPWWRRVQTEAYRAANALYLAPVR
jgi:dTDP-glucose 4,6-dehydratase